MGGHAVRFHGLARNTDDFDLHVAPDRWDDLPTLIAATALVTSGSLVEGPSWRTGVFRRFRIGALADGRDEWLECWKTNHLLAPHAELLARAERGPYGGREIAFLGLPDLIRSKETERDKDWNDVLVLERVLDARLLARVRSGQNGLAAALALLRSRAGFESYLAEGMLADTQAVASALGTTSLPITQAFLLPLAPASTPASPVYPIGSVVLERLRTVAPGSALHLSLVRGCPSTVHRVPQGRGSGGQAGSARQAAVDFVVAEAVFFSALRSSTAGSVSARSDSARWPALRAPLAFALACLLGHRTGNSLRSAGRSPNPPLLQNRT
jgi:hypothetical protein